MTGEFSLFRIAPQQLSLFCAARREGRTARRIGGHWKTFQPFSHRTVDLLPHRSRETRYTLRTCDSWTRGTLRTCEPMLLVITLRAVATSGEPGPITRDIVSDQLPGRNHLHNRRSERYFSAPGTSIRAGQTTKTSKSIGAQRISTP